MSSRADDLGTKQEVGDEWRDLFFPSPTGGVSSALDEELISTDKLLKAQNVFVHRGILQKDTGYIVRGVTLTREATTLDGTALFVESVEGFKVGDRIVFEDVDAIRVRTVDAIDGDNNEITAGAVANDPFSAYNLGTTVHKANLYISEKPRKHVSFRTIAGADFELVITNKHVYRKISDGWFYIGGGTTTTLSGNEASGQTVISVTDSTGFIVGDDIGITLDDGNQHKAAITNVSGNAITIGIPLASAAASGNTFIKAYELSGTDNEAVDTASPAWTDWLVFTNGVDKVQYYDPSTDLVQVIPNLPSSGDTVCKSLAIYDASLFLISTIEGGTAKRQRVRWSDKGDVTEWTAGDANFVDLLDFTHECLRALPLGPFLMIYRADSITRCQLASSLSKRFDFETLITDEGIGSIHAVVDIGDRHIVAGNSNFYFYTGGLDMQPIGDAVHPFVFGPTAPVDKDKLESSFLVYIQERRNVLWFYKSLDATADVDKAWRLDLDTMGWFSRTLAHEVAGFGLSTRLVSDTWNDLVGTWEEQTWTWGGTSGQIGVPILTLTHADMFAIVDFDFLVPSDNGIALDIDIETKDFGHPNFLARFDYIECLLSGSNIKISRSHDRGNSWTEIGTVTPGVILTRMRLHDQWTERLTRLRFETANAFQLGWINLRYNLEAEW